MLGRKRVTPRDTVLACVAAMAVNDRATIARLDPDFRKLSAEQIIGALGDFGQMIKLASKPERVPVVRETIKKELGTQPLSQQAQAAANALTVSLLIDADPKVVASRFTEHLPALQEDMMGVVMGCVMATASVVNELDIKLQFK